MATATGADATSQSTVAPTSSYRSPVTVRVALAALDTGGGVVSWVNPETASIHVIRVSIDLTTAATAACTVDVGTTATSATTSSDNIMDGLDFNAAVATFDSLGANGGTNGKTIQKLATGKWVTASKATGAAAGTAGYMYITYQII